MKRYLVSFLLLLFTSYFWLLAIAIPIMGLHSLLMFDPFSGVVALGALVLTLINLVFLEFHPLIKKITLENPVDLILPW